MDISSRWGADPVWRVLADLVAARPGLHVLDVGGGSGTVAVPLALSGCRVTVIDTSIDALAILRRRAVDAGVADRVESVQADADGVGDVVAAGTVDLALCHHVLEELDDPARALAGVAATLAPGGTVSMLVAGRFAAVLAQAMVGRYASAAAVLTDPAGRWGADDPLRRRFGADEVSELVAAAGLTVRRITGVGVASGLVHACARSGSAPDDDALAELEMLLGEHRPLLEIGTDLHVLAGPAG
ncbi:methyltransferase [Nakamurella endophytica]|uniref:Methyltransferase n=1 Tax=Nakamurella endophytica TaxID=1748367 RepID=A0A917T6S4_9ACTN|nr:methyltransferase [Nakamurella endophytica]